jgi:hypothetical protein
MTDATDQIFRSDESRDERGRGAAEKRRGKINYVAVGPVVARRAVAQLARSAIA